MIPQHTSTNQLISWAKRITNIQINRVQSLSDGYVICQILNHIYPNAINMHKINTKAKSNYEKQKNISLFFDAIFKENLPNLHVNRIDLALGKKTTILETLKWLHQRYQDVNKSKLKAPQEPKVIKNYFGIIATRKKVDEKDPRSKSGVQRSDKRRSQTCEPKNRQRSLQTSKIIKSNKVRQSKIQFDQNSLIKETAQPREVIESQQKPLDKKQMNFNRLSQTKQCVLSNDKIPKKQMKKQIPDQTIQQELNDFIIKLDPQILRSKMIKVATCFSQDQKTKYKLQQILTENSKVKKEIEIKEQKQSIESNQSETYFSIDNDTQNVQIDTAQSLQLEKNLNLVKIQISPRYKKESQIINASSKENMFNNQNLNQSNGEKLSMNQKSEKNTFSNKQNDKDLQRRKSFQMKVLKSMSGRKEKINLQRDTGQKTDQQYIPLSYPQLNPENKLQVEAPIIKTPIQKLSNDDLEI